MSDHDQTAGRSADGAADTATTPRRRVARVAAAVAALPVAALLAAGAPAAASTIEVTTTDDGALADAGVDCPAGGGDECTLRAAVETANDDDSVDVIDVPAGTYELTIATADDEAASGDLLLGDADVRIEGAGMGDTIIDAGWEDGGSDGIEDRVFRVEHGEVTIADLTITGGNTRYADSGGHHYGGGVFVRWGEVTLDNVEVTGNRAAGNNSGGAGLATQFDADLTVVDSEITDNVTASFNGGAVRTSFTSTATIENTLIEGNHASLHGGAIFAGGDAVEIVASTIVGNTADNLGGAVYAPSNDTDVTLVNTTVSANTTDDEDDDGSGAIHVDAENATVEFTHATVADNSGGAALYQGDDGEIVLAATIVDHPGGDACAGAGTPTSNNHNLASDGTCQLGGADDVEGGDAQLDPLDTVNSDLPVHMIAVDGDAFGAGPASPAVSVDQRGVARPQGDASDIGAVEVEWASRSGRIDAEVPGDNPPIDGATVEVRDQDTGELIDDDTTGADGEFTLEVPPGEYEVEEHADGFNSDSILWEPSEGSTVVNAIRELVPAESAGLTVAVDNPADVPVEGAEVTVDPVDISPVEWDGTTKETGTFGDADFDGLPVGTYDVHVDRDGYESTTESGYALADGDDETLEIELAYTEAIMVEAEDADTGDAIEDADVTVEGPSGFEADGQTDSDGEAVIELDGAGEYAVAVDHADYFADSTTVDVAEGEHHLIAAELDEVGVWGVFFQVQDDDGDPIEDAEVTVTNHTTGDEFTGTTNEDGNTLVDVEAADGHDVDAVVTADGYDDSAPQEIVGPGEPLFVLSEETEPAPDPAPDPEPELETVRVAGENRVETAAEVALETFDAADTALVATGHEHADALAAAPLAATVDGPLLLTWADDAAEPVVHDTLDALDVDEVLVIGETNAVPAAVADDLADAGHTVHRIGGADRYETAALVADEIADRNGGYDDAIVAASSTTDPDVGWPDVLSAGSYAITGDITPVLLTDPATLPDATADAVDGLDHVDIVGGPNAVDESVADAIDDAADNSDRIAGDDRYETSVAVADAAVDNGADSDPLWTATGTNWPDGLAASAASASEGTVVVLVHGDDPDASDVAHDWISDELPQLVRVAGGPNAVNDDVFDRVDDR